MRIEQKGEEMKAEIKRYIMFTGILMIVLTGSTVSAHSIHHKHEVDYSRCFVRGCNNLRYKGSYYCSEHKCAVFKCTAKKSSDGIYCEAHHKEFYANQSNWVKRNKSSSASGSSKKTSGKSRTKEDPYDVYSYSDPEDFYFDWEEDFDGYEDAEEYWEDAWN